MVLIDRSVTFQHVVLDRSVTFQHVVFDQSVTFWHDIFWSECHVSIRYSRISMSRSVTIILRKICLINGRYSISKNSTPKIDWFEGTSPHVWSLYRWLNTCLLYCYWHLFMLCVTYHILSAIVELILLFFVYKLLFWVDQWYLLSTCCLVLSLLVFFFVFLLWNATSVPMTIYFPQL